MSKADFSNRDFKREVGDRLYLMINIILNFTETVNFVKLIYLIY